jgi:TonB family protein
MLNFSIRKLSLVILFSLAAFLFTVASFSVKAELEAQLSDGNSLNLIGVGMHQELRNDIYLGALFAPAPITDADSLLNNDLAKRMSLRFVSNYSSRKIARHWKERLAMNNPRDQWQPLTKEIIRFSKIFKTGFKPGDEINIDYIPGAGTEVYLNGTLFKVIDKPEFMNLLLNVWLGTNPPTKAFKKDIRGKGENNSNLLNDYAAIQPPIGRFDGNLDRPVRVAQVVEPPPQQPVERPSSQQPIEVESSSATETVAVVVEEVAETTSDVVTRVADVTSSTSNTTEEVQVALAEKTTKAITENGSQNVNSSSSSIETIDNNNIAATDIENTTANNESISTEVINTEPVVETPQQVASLSKPDKVTEPEEDLFDADLLAGSYIRDLLAAIRKKQYYPEKALDKNQEGTVIAKVVVDVDGNPTDVKILERSRSVHLNRATIKIIKKASLPSIPKELKMNSFEFEVPMVFSLE